MKSMKKTLAIICALVIMATAVTVPFSAFTGNTLTLPSKMTLIDDFEGELSVAGWTKAGTAAFEKSSDYGYGESGNSLKVTFTSGYPGVKTSPSGRNWLVTDDGIAFWLYAPTALTAGKNLYAKVTLKAPGNTTNATYEKAIPVNSLSVGENIITVAWEDFAFNKGDNAITFDTHGVYIYQFELIANFTTENIAYLDNVGIYRDDNAPVEFIPSTVTMPSNYLLLEDFSTASAWLWQPHGAELEYSAERGYGTEGRSAHVTWSTAGWNGMKTTLTNINLQLKGDGFAFWAYNMTSELTNFAVVLTQGGVKYEKIITLAAGEAVYKISFTEFAKDGATIDPTGTVSQIDFTKSLNSANYYIDELAFYNEDGTCIEHIYDSDYDVECNSCGAIREVNRYESTLSLPDYYYPVENFDGENIFGWQAHNATLTFAEDCVYGKEGKSAYISWNTSTWGGFKTMNSPGINLSLMGDGLTFWAYNAGSELTNFAVVLLQGTTKYEKKITLTAGEAVYTIPWTEFKNGENSVDTRLEIAQIDFTKSASSAKYYIDEIGFYNADGSCVEHVDDDGDYTCDICEEVLLMPHQHSYGDWIVVTEATKDANGSKYKECICGDKVTAIIPRILRFNGASLTLESNVAINYKFSPVYNDIYDEIYIVVEFNGQEYTIYDPELSGGSMQFSFKAVSGHMMTDNATATIYGILDGEVYKGQTADYSAVTYAKTMLPKDTLTDVVRKLIVDLVNYGAAAQVYTNHNTDTLANSWLTDEQKALATQEVRETTTHQNLKYKVINNPSVVWKGAGLRLDSAITIRYKIEAADISGLSAVLLLNGETFTIDASEFVPVENTNNQYFIYFTGATASQMSLPVLATIVKGNTEVSNTVQYSVESYIHTNKDKTSPLGLGALLKEMLKYGDSAFAYNISNRKVTADYVWHPGLPNEDVYYDLAISIDDVPVDVGTYTLSSKVDGVTCSQNRVILKYSARESGKDVIITVKHNSGAVGNISIPCYKWTQTFNDDFNGTELDRTKWTEGSTLTTVAPDDVSDYEVIDRAKPAKDCFTVSDGKLNMLIKAEPTYDTNNKIKYLYSECCLRTTNKYDQTFGLFQARVASAKFSGINTAFWLLPRGSYSKYYTNFLSSDPRYGLSEIDILESSVAFGKYDRRSFAISEHFYDYTNNYTAGNKRAAYYKVNGTLTDFHTYSCIWTANALYYYVDNELIRISDGLQTESADGRQITPVHMIVDVSLYLDNGWVGKRDFEASDLPIAGYVDWVRAYQFN